MTLDITEQKNKEGMVDNDSGQIYPWIIQTVSQLGSCENVQQHAL